LAYRFSEKDITSLGGLGSPSLGGNIKMSSYDSLSHSRWDCKYHVVFISNSHYGDNWPTWGGRGVAKRSAIFESRIAFFHERAHAFLAVLGGESGVERPAFEPQPFLQRAVESDIH
jgi:hypothetical protein